ncbi:hypothetical protein [Bergeyella zoohelcum]|uniref:Uncharacterized protein n=1 Tax=Bergeyella zoohelcum ATCC 43767 TaxID=883096 RepID=K1LZR6_9FLAO|nr:hypothetical protein [Bergeyella zoohelcum]EKB57527.1 hypothetical protein HMPREF9699_01013 [Bergeyella zoohelcum ATCC 43767]SUV48803.1 Uncharacterised protein [Bergeyella zoohelcum]
MDSEEEDKIREKIYKLHERLISKEWAEDRKRAYESIKEMQKHLESLSEEEAHKLMVEQTQRILKGGQLSRRRKFKKI